MRKFENGRKSQELVSKGEMLGKPGMNAENWELQ